MVCSDGFAPRTSSLQKNMPFWLYIFTIWNFFLSPGLSALECTTVTQRGCVQCFSPSWQTWKLLGSGACGEWVCAALTMDLFSSSYNNSVSSLYADAHADLI